jgi:hypothetical protein
MLSGLDFPGSANLPIGDSQNAIQENGAPGKGQTAPHAEVSVMNLSYSPELTREQSPRWAKDNYTHNKSGRYARVLPRGPHTSLSLLL